jgi:DNA-3-methyladenine glycosylase I
LGSAENLDYHDDEWGRPVRDDQGIFERLCLEAFQSGLSWLTILRKRENFRAAFCGFDMAAVSAFGPADVARLLGDAGIVRNRAKIEAAIGGLTALVWRYADASPGPDHEASAGTAPVSTAPVSTAPVSTGPVSTGPVSEAPVSEAPVSTADIPSWTPASKDLSRELRLRGFSFTGPVTAYATMQACGIVDDHLLSCFRRGTYSGSG